MAFVPSGGGKTKSGYYKIINSHKYMGNPSDIVFRSSWEYKFMVYCDLNTGILKWGSEPFKIPYIDYLGHHRTYIPDFYVESLNNQNPDFINKFLVEVKPDKEIREPVIPKTITEKKLKNLEYELSVWQKNKHKWVFAKEWAKNRDMQFWLITENNLNSFKP